MILAEDISNYTDHINERAVHQGNLVFIVHNEKFYKTGWWRKIVNYVGNEVIYVLEKPMCADYKNHLNDGSRKENDKYIMRAKTLSYCQKFYEDKYNILISVSGIEQYIITDSNYLVNADASTLEKLKDSNNVIATREGLEFLEKYIGKSIKSNTDKLIEKLI